MPRPYAFISYTTPDLDRALSLADTLVAAGVPVWIDRRSIAAGTSWDAEIVKGIRNCSAFLALCSGESMQSVNVQQELRLALEERRPVIPLMLEPVTFPDEVRYALAGR